MERIRSFRDVPSWFNLDNYIGIHREFDEEFLFVCCQSRLQTLLKLDEIEVNDTVVWNHEKNMFVVSNKIAQRVKAKYLRDPEITSEYLQIAHCLKDNLPFSPGVRPLSVNEVVKIGKEAEKLLSNDDIKDTFNSFDLEREGNSLGKKYLHLRLDLSYSDNELVQKLIGRLPEIREKFCVENRENDFDESDVSKIKNYKIIPLIDLKIWEKSEKKIINQNVLEHWLFQGDCGTDHLRKTVYPLLDRLTSTNFMDQWASSLVSRGMLSINRK